MVDPFIHLHSHTEYSLLDGMSTLEELAKKCVEFGSPAFTATDHGNMAGTVQGFNVARKYGLKFIPGQEIYFADKHTEPQSDDNPTYHMTLLAMSDEGYRNLVKISSIGATEGAWGANAKRVSLDILDQYSEGLFATLGCLSSKYNSLLLEGKHKKARRHASEVMDIFGKGMVGTEVMNHELSQQLKITERQVADSQELGTLLIATNDSHYTHAHDSDAHDHLLCLGTGATMLDEKRFQFGTKEFYYKSPQEMRKLFPDHSFPGACDNTITVAEMCEVSHPEEQGMLIPRYEYEEAGFSSDGEMLRDHAYKGAHRIYGNTLPKEVTERLEMELEVISNMGFNSYFLIVEELMRFCRENNIWYGHGRGSAAGSLVTYCVGITRVDPLEHGLFFERFLNAGRKGMPDIDVDIETARRAEVVQYAVNRWGEERVARISTFGTMKAKGALQDISRAAAQRNVGIEAAALVSADEGLEVMLSDTRPEGDEKAERMWDEAEELREYVKGDKAKKRIGDIAKSVEGRIRQHGHHPAGILITPSEVSDHFPIRKGKDGINICQYDCDDVDQTGGLKMDLLGLRNVSVLRSAVEKIRRDVGEEVNLDEIPMDDPVPYQMLSEGRADGIFQLESEGMRRMMKSMKPNKFGDISAGIALYRPGPMGTGVHNDYAERKNGKQKITYFHPDAKPILEETYGLCVFQESIMSIAQKFAGYSLREADDFRRAMGKKKADVMEALHGEFVDRVEGQGYTRKLGVEIWNIIEPFAGYAFNKSHSVAYGYISYQTLWLKANYYPQFVGAYLDNFSSHDKIFPVVQEAIANGVSILPPDINLSNSDSTTTKTSVHIGFDRVARVGHAAQEQIIGERSDNGPYKSLINFMERNSFRGSAVHTNAVAELIYSGAFSSLEGHSSRQLMVDSLDEVKSYAMGLASSKASSSSVGGGFDLFGDVREEEEAQRFNFDAEPTSSRDAKRMEQASLGFFVGQHPYKEYEPLIDGLRERGVIPDEAVSITEALRLGMTGNHSVFGVLTDYTETTSKKGKKMTRYTVETDGGSISGFKMAHNVFSEDDLLSLMLLTGPIEDDSSGVSFDDGEEGEGQSRKLKFGFRVSISPISQQGERSGRNRRRTVTERAEKEKAETKPQASREDVRARARSRVRQYTKGTIPEDATVVFRLPRDARYLAEFVKRLPDLLEPDDRGGVVVTDGHAEYTIRGRIASGKLGAPRRLLNELNYRHKKEGRVEVEPQQ